MQITAALSAPLLLPLTALEESRLVRPLLPGLRPQKQRDGWPSAVALEAIAGESSKLFVLK